MNLNFEDFESAYLMIDQLSSEESLRMIEVVSFPHIEDKEKRVAIHREHFKRANAGNMKEKKALTLPELAKFLSANGTKNGR